MHHDSAAAHNLAPSDVPYRRARDYLERRSRLMQKLVDHVHLSLVHIIDDSRSDAAILTSNLRKILGRDVHILTSTSPAALKSQWAHRVPDAVFVDDRLGHGATAISVIPMLRRIGYLGPIIAVSGLLTQPRRVELIRAGAAGVLHKDDYNSLRLIELLLELFAPGEGEGGSL